MRFGIMKRYAICIVASVIVSIGVVLGGSCGLAYAAVTSDQLWVELPGGKEVHVQEVDGANACSCRLRLIRENYPSSLLLVRCGCLMGRMVHFARLLAVSI